MIGYSCGHRSCGTLEIVPSQQCVTAGAPSASPSPSIPLEPKALLGIPNTVFKQSLALRSQHSLSLYLYSEALVKPSQCCFNSCYCCFSRDRVLYLLSRTCSVLFMGHSNRSMDCFFSTLHWHMKINRVITQAQRGHCFIK